MTKVIKNGMIATDSQVFQGDILIENETIKAIGIDLSADGAEVIDAAGKYVLPGAVDVHTHMDLQSGKYRAVDDFYDGTVAAACGGTTSIVDHMAFGPVGCSLWHQVEEYHRLADDKAVIDYGFHGVIQHVNPSVLKEMKEIAEKEGITSFKIYMTYDFMLKDEDIFRVLKQAKEDGIVIAVHCENDGVINYLRKTYVEEGCMEPKYHPLSRPARCEAEAVNRMLHLSAMAGGAPLYIVHLSSKEGLLEVMKARASHQEHFAVETCTQYLTLTDDLYQDRQEGLKAIMSPPLRKKEDIEALWEGLHDNIIDTIGTDHCPFNFAKEKQAGADDF
ncbi:MAG TPA: dihydropyrimidinase, partial [Lachnospiraceae bacterium]|nr:dihydropyrimidinase [Lachnospiraceae bacterium]